MKGKAPANNAETPFMKRENWKKRETENLSLKGWNDRHFRPLRSCFVSALFTYQDVVLVDLLTSIIHSELAHALAKNMSRMHAYVTDKSDDVNKQ